MTPRFIFIDKIIDHQDEVSRKGWTQKSFRFLGDVYYLVVLFSLTVYTLLYNFDLLYVSFGLTIISAVISYLYLKHKNKFIYNIGFISRYLLFFSITPIAFLANIKLVAIGIAVYTFIWLIAEQAEFRFIPQGFMLSLAVIAAGLFLAKLSILSSTVPSFLALRETELTGLVFVPSFLRNETIHMLRGYSALEGAGYLSLFVTPVIFTRRIEFFISFIILFVGFGIGYELNQFEMAVTWLVIYFQPGKKIIERPFITLFSSFVVLCSIISLKFLEISPLFFIILYFLIEGIGHIIFSKSKRVL